MVEVVDAICGIAAPNTRSRRQVFITLVCVPSIADALNECESDIRRDDALRSLQDFQNTFGVPQAGFSVTVPPPFEPWLQLANNIRVIDSRNPPFRNKEFL